jgi:hypothetical protein
MCKNFPTIGRKGIGKEGRKDHENRWPGEPRAFGSLASLSFPIAFGARSNFPSLIRAGARRPARAFGCGLRSDPWGNPSQRSRNWCWKLFSRWRGVACNARRPGKKIAGILKTPAKSGPSIQTPSRWPMILSCSLFR